MNIAGLDIATTSGLACMKDGVVTTQTFRAAPKKKFVDRDDGKSLDAEAEGEIGRRFADFLRVWLIENEISHVAIEAPIPSNNTRKKTVVNPSASFAGQALMKTEAPGTSMAAIYRIYGLSFMAATICRRLNVSVVLVAQSTWRKEFLGNGRPKDAKKEAKLMAEKLGVKCSSLDAAEAVGIVIWLDRTLNPYSSRRAHDLFRNSTSAPP